MLKTALVLMLTWYGHASFTIKTPKTTVVVDPYRQQGDLFNYPTRSWIGDVVCTTHNHWDHNNIPAVKRAKTKTPRWPLILRGLSRTNTFIPVNYRRTDDLGIKTVASFHDPVRGTKRGPNAIFLFTYQGIRMVHLGDIGQKKLSAEQLKAIGKVDVLLTPIGGFYTAKLAWIRLMVDQLNPWIVVPMHYRTAHSNKLPIAPQNACAPAKKPVKRPEVHCTGKSTLDLVAQLKTVRAAKKRKQWLFMKYVGQK